MLLRTNSRCDGKIMKAALLFARVADLQFVCDRAAEILVLARAKVTPAIRIGKTPGPRSGTILALR